MKKFLDFITEAVETTASAQAKRMGLVGNGHGDWYDSKGKLVAKTVNKQLKVFSGKPSSKKEKDETERPEPAKISGKAKSAYSGGRKRLGKTPTTSSASSGSDRSASSSASMAGQQQSQIRTDVVTVSFGKFNPPTKGHQKLLKVMEQSSTGGNFYIFPSRTQDNKRNPLDPETKIAYMQEMFPEYADRIIDSDEFKTIFDALAFLNQEGYTTVNIVVGDERVSEVDSLTAKANGNLYQYQSINVVSAGPKDPDSESESSIARKSAADGDYQTFLKSMPSGVDESIIKQLFMDLRSTMGIKEGYNLWEISPELDWSGLREMYITKKIFKVGSIVENCNTGLRGEIIRSGANHLICLTDDGMMFKSWIKDVCEVHEIGTDEYREYVQKLTPYQKVEKYSKPQSKLNKKRTSIN